MGSLESPKANALMLCHYPKGFCQRQNN
jgi:hypothetical protein